MKHFILLWFLTLGMVGYTATEATVTKVENGIVTMVSEGREYMIEEAEAWRVGDRAEVIIREGEIILERWKKRQTALTAGSN